MGKHSTAHEPLDPFESPSNPTIEELYFRSVEIVDQLAVYVPFDGQKRKPLSAEHHARDSGLHYETRALGHIRGLLSNPSVSLIVLTGDAGHGKTHLCYQLLQSGGLSPEEARAKICNDPAGRTPIVLAEPNRPVRVIKDLSEFEPEVAAQLLVDLLDDESTIGIVSATEDRLRSAASRRPLRLSVILHTLKRGLVHGETADENGRIHVVNLNFQSVVPLDDQQGFIRYLLDAWTSDERKWESCASCKAKPHCPISRNRERLAGLAGGPSSWSWRDGLIQLIRTAEQAGYLLSFREALPLIAYLLSGGLRCSDVHVFVQREQHHELTNRRLERLLFERPLEVEPLRVMTWLRRYDPGRVAHRDIDDEIVDALELDGALGNATCLGPAPRPQTLEQSQVEALRLVALVCSKRREVYFEVAAQGLAGIFDRARRLGLYYYLLFHSLQGPEEDPARTKAVVGQLIAGLNALQGIRRSDTTYLYVLDPVSSRAGSGVGVIAGRVRRNKLSLRGLPACWRDKKLGATPTLSEAVDWLDRSVVLHDDQGRVLLELDVIQFEFLLRAADGVAFLTFHAAERLRVLTRLGQLAEHLPRENDTIHVVAAGNIYEVGFDGDGPIEVRGRGQ